MLLLLPPFGGTTRSCVLVRGVDSMRLTVIRQPPPGRDLITHPAARFLLLPCGAARCCVYGCTGEWPVIAATTAWWCDP